MTYTPPLKEPIAIVGAGCRFPGDATSTSKLWGLLRAPRDLTKKIPESRFNPDGFYHPNGEHHGTSDVSKAYFLEDDPRLYDAAFFRMAPREAEAVDPQQRLLLETVYEAMESSGQTLESLRGSDTSCFVGVMTGDYAEIVTRDPETFSQYMATGTSRAIISNRVSYAFDWRGPSMTVDTACSSSLVAVHLAVQSLRNNESRVACAAGSNLILNPDTFIGESSLHMISPDGKSKMWDVSANGYARGEGVAAIILKPLSKALEDGDRIEALIRETGVNQDGRTQGITLPSPEAQARLIQSTYRSAGLDPLSPQDRPQFFEAHGTGTQAGDPREASAIQQAFFPGAATDGGGDSDGGVLHVGSIKTVIGHTEGCAGVAGLLKAALSLRHGEISPNQHFQTLNPSVAPFCKNLRVPVALQAWPPVPVGSAARASVNSFGFGGTNAHAILERYDPAIHGPGPQPQPQPVAAAAAAAAVGAGMAALNTGDFSPVPLLLSANSQRALSSLVGAYREYLREDDGASLLGLATTLQSRRSVLPFKASFAGPTRDDLLKSMSTALDAENQGGAAVGRSTPAISRGARILGVFTGQGAQWPAMSRRLIQTSHLFRATIEELDQSLGRLPDPPAWTLMGELAAVGPESRMHEAAVSQPACTAVQVALIRLLAVAGISFHTVVGHSSGEIAAAHAAGFISASDAIRIAYYRGVHAHLARGEAGQPGSMIAVGLGPHEARALCSSPPFVGRLSVAASNSPSSTTLSGDRDAVGQAKRALDAKGTFNRPLQVDTAYHSHHMNTCAGPYLASLHACNIVVQEAQSGCAWMSSVRSGAQMGPHDSEALRGTYWRDNMVGEVQFTQAVGAAVSSVSGGFDLALEVGPHPALKGPALETIKAQLDGAIPYLGLLDRRRDDVAAFSGALGSLWTDFGPHVVDFGGYASAFDGPGGVAARSRKPICPPPNLPVYPWDHQRLWRESRVNRQLRTRREAPHDILGARTTDDVDHEPRWRNILRLEELPWLRDHRIQGQIVVPGAAYLVMALEAARTLCRGHDVRAIELRDVSILKAIALEEASEGTETLFSLKTIDGPPDIDGRPSMTSLDAEFTLSAAAVEDVTMRKVCAGRVSILLGKGGGGGRERVSRPSPTIRDAGDKNLMNTGRFYSALEEAGLGYTGAFRAISHLERRAGNASAFVVVDRDTIANSTPMHPTWIDACLQTVFAAFAASGDGTLRTAFVPTKIDRVVFPAGAAGVQQRGWAGWQGENGGDDDDDDDSPGVFVESHITSFHAASPDSLPSLTADIEVNGGKAAPLAAFRIKGLTMASFVPATAADDRTVFQRTEWQDDPCSGVLAGWTAPKTPEEELEMMAACEQVAQSYVRKLSSEHPGEGPAVHQMPSADDHTPLGDTAAQELIERFGDSLEMQTMIAAGDKLLSATRPLYGGSKKAAWRAFEELSQRWLTSRQSLARAEAMVMDAVGQITHRYPNLDVLHVGASSAGFVQKVNETRGGRGATYTVTARSKEHVKAMLYTPSVPGDRTKFEVLDLSCDSGRGALGHETFDLIVCRNFNTDETPAAALRELLRPGGFLVLEKPHGASSYLSLIHAASQGTAVAMDDPSASLVAVASNLQDNGFSGIETVAFDSDKSPAQSAVVIVTQATDAAVDLLRQPLLRSPLSPELFTGRIAVVGGASIASSKFISEVGHSLASVWAGDIVLIESLRDLDQASVQDADVTLSLVDVDVDEPTIRALDEGLLAKLQLLFGGTQSVLWITQTTSHTGPFQSAMVGLGRTVAAENPQLALQFLDLDRLDRPNAVTVAESLLRLVAARRLEGRPDAPRVWTTEPEMAVTGGRLRIPRVCMDKSRNNRINAVERVVMGQQGLEEGGVTTIAPVRGGAFRAQAELTWPRPCAPGRLELRVEYSSARPFLTGRGRSDLWLCVGTTAAGERFLAATERNASVVRVSHDVAVPFPEALGSLGGLVMSRLLCFIEAELIMMLVANGAAVLVCGWDQALATILESHYGQREDEAVYLVDFDWDADKTERAGHNITLGPGTTQRELRALIPSGVGSVVTLGTGQDAVLRALAFCVPDPDVHCPVSDIRPTKSTGELLQGAIQREQDATDSVLPLVFGRVAKASEMVERRAQESSSSSIHERLVVDWNGPQALKVQVRPLDATSIFSPTKTYLLVGLAGPMGQSICRWMVSNGARRIVVTSRNPDKESLWKQELEFAGAEIRIEAADVTRRDSMAQLCRRIQETMPPIAGVMNGAMVLMDGMFSTASYERMRSSLEPKVRGSMVLDNIFSGKQLDFFVMFSSVNAATGMTGQANYTAANMFMAGLAADRRRRGLAASVVDIGMVIGLGIIQRTEGDSGTGAIETNLRRQNLLPISERDLHFMIAETILSSQSDQDVEIITGLQQYDYSSPNRPLWHDNPRFSHLVGPTEEPGTGTGRSPQAREHTPQAMMDTASSPEQARSIFEDEFGRYLTAALKLPEGGINAESSIIDLGVDSLVAGEIRLWLLSTFQADVPALKILGGSSIRQVADEIVSKWEARRTGTGTGTGTKAPETQQASYKPEGSEGRAAHGSDAVPQAPSDSDPSTGQAGSDTAGSGNLTPGTEPSEDSSQADIPSVLKQGPLSLGQSRLFVSSLYLDDPAPFNCTTAYHISGPLDIPRLRRALRTVCMRHEIFRTVFQTDQATGEATQAVLAAPHFELQLVEAAGQDGTAVRREFDRIHAYSYNLAKGDHFIATLLCHDATSHTIVFGYHHIIIDGVSWQLFLEDVARAYSGALGVTAPPPAQCLSFAVGQRRDIETGAYNGRLEFWSSMFAARPPPLPLFPFAKVTHRKPLTRYSMRDMVIPVEASLVSHIRQSSREARTTSFHFWLAAFQLMLHRMLGVNDVTVGIVDANRFDPAYASTVGFLLEIMPVRFRVSADQPFSDIMTSTRTTTYAALGQAGVPVEEIARACGIPSSATETPLAQVVFNYRMGATRAPRLDSATEMTFLDYADAKVPFDLAVSVDEKDDGSGLVTISAQDYLYDQEGLELLTSTYKHLLTYLAENTSSLAGGVPLYDESSVERAIQLGTGRSMDLVEPTDTLSKSFQRWASQEPQAVAVKEPSGRAVTYLMLSRRVAAMASTLQHAGLRPGQNVCALLEPTADTIAAMLAIVSSGAVYVPLDVYLSDLQLSSILDECHPHLLVHHPATASRASTLTTGRTARLVDLSSAPDETVQPVSDASTHEATALILYTSGSTGKPKGIGMTNANVLHVVASASARLSLGREVVLQQSGQGFDAAVFQVFVALLNGGTVVLGDNHGDPSDLAALMVREKVTFALFIVSEMRNLLRYGLEQLRACTSWRIALCGGEAVTTSLADSFSALGLPSLRLFNAYGPTEASILCSLGEVDIDADRASPDDYRIPVGTALPNYAVIVVDQDQKPVPVGWAGEVAICGPGVTSGYLGRPDLTGAKFKRAAVHTVGQPRPAWDRMYLTGDKGRMLADGSVVLLGRIDGDSMIKLRGRRVELGEVSDAVVQASSGRLSDAVVVVRGEDPAHQFLAAFVVFAETSADNGSAAAERSDFLRSLLRGLELPAYMRPVVAVPLDSLPLTERGKLDTKSLVDHELPAARAGGEQAAEEELSKSEKVLMGIWEDVISETGATIPIQRQSDFFSVGGNSLLLLRLRAEIRRVFGTAVPLAQLFQASTLASLAAWLDGTSAPQDGPIDWDDETAPGEDLLLAAAASHRAPEGAARTAPGHSILLTGATGFLGSAILRQLVDSDHVRRVHCVAVRDPQGLQVSSPKIIVHAGDLASPRLGLPSDGAAAAVFSDVDAVIHNGAAVSHMKSYRSLRAANVGSTREIARLMLLHGRAGAAAAGPALHFISTGGVALLTGEASLPEARLPDNAVPAPDGSLGYVGTKYASERLLERLFCGGCDGRLGAVVVHRPSNITGDGAPGQDIVHNVLRFAAELRAVPRLPPDFGAIDLVHVDSVARAVVADVLTDVLGARGAREAGGGGVLYRHQSGETVIPGDKLGEHLGHGEGTEFRVLELRDWVGEATARGMDGLVGAFLVGSGGAMRMPLLEKGS